MLEYIKIGQIVNIHGVKGDVKVYPLTDSLERFRGLKEVYLETKTGYELKKVTGHKFLAEMVVLHIEGVDTAEMAQKMRNTYLCVDRSHTVKLPKDTWLICDLIGLEVFNEAGLRYGNVKDVLQLGSNDVYVVKREQGKEDLLIPALRSVVQTVDINGGKMVVELPEGLLEEE